MSSTGRRLLIAVLMLAGLLGFSASGVSAQEQGTITVHKTWAGQAPTEVVQVCFAVSSDAAGTDILGTACTSDETYTVVFGPAEPALATGVTYYVWEVASDTGAILQGPVEAVIPAAAGNVDVTFENPGEPLPPEQITFRISKYTCPEDPGNVSVAAGNIPASCAPTAGVGFSVAAQDGTQIGTCTTDGTGVCSLQVPNEATVTVTEDTTTAPAGYAPRENPITTQAVTEFAGALFINLPVSAPPPTVVPTAAPTAPAPSGGVITLPSTGSGPASGPTSGSDLPWTPLLAAGGALALAGTALVHRRANRT